MADVSVRTAHEGDAGDIARVQAAAWRTAYGEALPPEVLDAVGSTDATDRWRDSVLAPPTPRHRVLVAVDTGEVVGFAAFGPDETDTATAEHAELHVLCVDPAYAHRGHGSRLLNASIDNLRGDGFRRASSWVPQLTADDERLTAFLAGAGWGPDGGRRRLDLYGDGTVVVPQVSLVTTFDDQPGPDHP